MNNRRAFAIAAAVLVLAALNLMLVSAVTIRGDDRQADALAAHALRAAAAAESALCVAEIQRLRAEPFPAGTTELPAGESYALVDQNDQGGGVIWVRVTGAFGLAQRTADATLGP